MKTVVITREFNLNSYTSFLLWRVRAFFPFVLQTDFHETCYSLCRVLQYLRILWSRHRKATVIILRYFNSL